LAGSKNTTLNTDCPTVGAGAFGSGGKVAPANGSDIGSAPKSIGGGDANGSAAGAGSAAGTGAGAGSSASNSNLNLLNDSISMIVLFINQKWGH
jgi:hypothetical protein